MFKSPISTSLDTAHQSRSYRPFQLPTKQVFAISDSYTTNDVVALSAEIQRMDKEIDQLTDKLRSLQMQRNAALIAYQRIKEYTAPIRSLPVEILLEVFYLVMPWLSFETDDGSLIPMGVIPQPGPYRQRTTLCLVCHHWKEIVYSAPRFWHTIVLDNPEFFDVSSLHFNITLSKTRPLEILFRGSGWFRDWRNTRDAFSLLVLQIKRIRILLTDYILLDGSPPWGQMFPIGTITPFPSLEHLRITGASAGAGTAIHAPKLKTLNLGMLDSGEMKTFQFTQETFHTLRHLSVASHRQRGLILGGAFANLTHLTVSRSNLNPFPKLFCAELPALRTLELINCLISSMFFRYLTSLDDVPGKEGFCQNLDTVVIWGKNTTLSPNDLAHFVGKRQLGRKNVVRLQAVHVRHWFSLQKRWLSSREASQVPQMLDLARRFPEIVRLYNEYSPDNIA